jgi:ketosteroid isomerase-like protein
MPEAETRAAAEAYRREHETQDLDALMEQYAEDAVFHTAGREPTVGKDAIRTLLAGWMIRPEPRKMAYTRLVVNGDEAAAEWRSTRINPDGSEQYRYGAVAFEIRNGKIIYTRLYQG